MAGPRTAAAPARGGKATRGGKGGHGASKSTRSSARGQAAAGGGEEEEAGEEARLFFEDRSGDASAGKESKKKKGGPKKGEDNDEADLAALLFGDAQPPDAPPGDRRAQEEEEEEGGESDEDESDGEDGGGERGGARGEGEGAWDDADDVEVRVDVAGRDRLRKLRATEDETVLSGSELAARLRRHKTSNAGGTVGWATRKKQKPEEEEDGEELLRSSAPILAAKSARLPRAALDVERLKDANKEDVSDAVIQVVKFHPNSQLMLTASLDKRLKLFQVDGKHNSKVQSVFFEDLPILSASFSADGSEVYVAGRRKFFYIYDLAAARISKVEGLFGSQDKRLGELLVAPDGSQIAILGSLGTVNILSAKTKQKVGDLKMNGDVRCAAFTPDGRGLFTGGQGGIVYHWDMRMRRCVRKIVDEGAINVTSLACSSVGGILAVGSQSGVVNTYDTSSWDSMTLGPAGEIRPASRKGIMNLTTPVSTLRFNPDSQMLVAASHATKEALRVVHTDSSSVFANWPTSGTPLHSVSAADFSPNSRFLSIGNDRGKVLLYRLRHYT